MVRYECIDFLLFIGMMMKWGRFFFYHSTVVVRNKEFEFPIFDIKTVFSGDKAYITKRRGWVGKRGDRVQNCSIFSHIW